MVLMKRLQGNTCIVCEYVRDGHGVSTSVGSEGRTLDAGPEVERQELEKVADDDDENETWSEDHPLLILYDCEATGFSVYSDHIADIGPKSLLLQLHSCSTHFPALFEHHEQFVLLVKKSNK